VVANGNSFRTHWKPNSSWQTGKEKRARWGIGSGTTGANVFGKGPKLGQDIPKKRPTAIQKSINTESRGPGLKKKKKSPFTQAGSPSDVAGWVYQRGGEIRLSPAEGKK